MFYRYLSCSLVFLSGTACFANDMPIFGGVMLLCGLVCFCANVVIDCYADLDDEAA